MKLDKETMIKQRFWFLLPVFALCLLIGWICVLGVRGETETNYKSAGEKNNALKSLAAKTEIKNPQWIEAIGKEHEVSTAKKLELWNKEYDRQNKVVRDPKNPGQFRRTAPFFTWPEKTRAQWMKTSQGRDLYNMDFGEYLGTIPSDEYKEEYLAQFQAVADIIRDWLNETPGSNVTGAVRVIDAKDNHRNYVINTLLKPHQLTAKQILSDEIHLLQEDIAVKREIFLSLSDLLDSYSKLKPEWSEVPFVEIKEMPAPTAPVAPVAAAEGQPAVAAASPPPAAEAAAPKKDAEPEVYQKVRFYNYIWPNLLNTAEVAQSVKLKSTTVDFGLPASDPYKGWRLDLAVAQDPQDEKKAVLRVVSANHSDLFTIPSIPLVIYYSELGNDQEVATPLYLNDAGNLGPCEYWPNTTIKKISQKKLKDIPLPANFGRVTRIARVLPENAIAQRIDFNHDWVVQAQLVQRANSPTLTLRGEIINRSGRRLPVASFNAGLMLPNTTNLLNEEFKVPTDAFNAGERRPFAMEIKNPVQPRGIALIRQKLTWRSTPIKRIDRLEVGKLAHDHSDRLKTLPLLAYDFKLKDPLGQNAPPAPAAGTTTEGGSGVSAGLGGGSGRSIGGDMPGGGGGRAGGGAQAANLSPNQGVPLDRYIQVSSELRRMPVALVMIVDATAITDIIAAMSNSKLRFQVTMAPWVRVPNLGRPGGSGTATAAAAPPANNPGGAGGTGGGISAGAAGGARPAGNTGGGGGGGGRMEGLGGEGSTGGSPPGAPAGQGAPRPAAGSLGLEDDSSVVELQIYGVVTIYESPDQFKRIQEMKANAPAQQAAAAPRNNNRFIHRLRAAQAAFRDSGLHKSGLHRGVGTWPSQRSMPKSSCCNTVIVSASASRGFSLFCLCSSPCWAAAGAFPPSRSKTAERKPTRRSNEVR
ncbi:MAG: hypothetical protein QM703_07700 [Gemmatales bacterium]